MAFGDLIHREDLYLGFVLEKIGRATYGLGRYFMPSGYYYASPPDVIVIISDTFDTFEYVPKAFPSGSFGGVLVYLNGSLYSFYPGSVSGDLAESLGYSASSEGWCNVVVWDNLEAFYNDTNGLMNKLSSTPDRRSPLYQDPDPFTIKVCVDVKLYKNKFFVLDRHKNHIFLVNPTSLEVEDYFLEEGNGSFAVNFGVGICFIDDICFVADRGNSRVTSYKILSVNPLEVSFGPFEFTYDSDIYGLLVGIGSWSNQLYVLFKDDVREKFYLKVYALDLYTGEVIKEYPLVDVTSAFNFYSEDGWFDRTLDLNLCGNPFLSVSNGGAGIEFVYLCFGGGVYYDYHVRRVVLENEYETHFLNNLSFSLLVQRPEFVQNIPFSPAFDIEGVNNVYPVEIEASGWGQLNTFEEELAVEIDSFGGIYNMHGDLPFDILLSVPVFVQSISFEALAGDNGISIDIFPFAEMEGRIQPIVESQLDVSIRDFMELFASTPFFLFADSMDLPSVTIESRLGEDGHLLAGLFVPEIDMLIRTGASVFASHEIEIECSAVPVPDVSINLNVPPPVILGSFTVHPIGFVSLSFMPPRLVWDYTLELPNIVTVRVPDVVLRSRGSVPPRIDVNIDISAPSLDTSIVSVPLIKMFIEPSTRLFARLIGVSEWKSDRLFIMNLKNKSASFVNALSGIKALGSYNDKLIVVTDDGIYEEDISVSPSYFITGEIDINAPVVKNYLYLFISGKVDEGILTVYTDKGQSFRYDLSKMPYRDGERRIVLGRGLRSRYLKFKIESTKPLEIDSIRLLAEGSRRVR